MNGHRRGLCSTTRVLASMLFAALALAGLAACSPLDGLRQANAERMLDEAVGGHGTASVQYENRIAAGVACSARATMATADAEVVTALAGALATIATDEVLPGCDLALNVRFEDSRLSMSIDAATTTRIEPEQWASVLEFAVESGATYVAAFTDRSADEDTDSLRYLIDAPETIDFADVLAVVDPLVRSDAPADGFTTTELTIRGCGPTYWGPMADGTEGSPTHGAEIDLADSGYGSEITKCLGGQPVLDVPLPLPADARAAIDAIAASTAGTLGPLDAITGDVVVTAQPGAASLVVADLGVFVRAESTVSDAPERPEVLAAAEAIEAAIAATGVDYRLTITDPWRTVLETSGP